MHNSTSLMNLYNPALSKQKGIDNQSKLLEFLLQEKYSTADVLQSIIDVKTRSAICAILRKMATKNLIKRYEVNPWIILWGITQNGLHEAQQSAPKITDWNYFEPSKISPVTLDHQLDTQWVHACCFKEGIPFITGRELGSRADSDKVPDGIIQIHNKRIALEVERHVKSKRRYDAVIYNYLKLVKAKEFDLVLYVSPDNVKAGQIKKAIHSIDQITMKVNGQNKILQINPEVHLSYFEFIALPNVVDYLRHLQQFYAS